MKLMLIIGLLSMVGCSKEIKKESCTYNGQSIPCKEMPRGNNQNQVSTLSGRVLKAHLIAAISVDTYNRTIEFLENTYDEEVATTAQAEARCGVETISGDQATYTLLGSRISLKMRGERMMLNRIAGSRDGLNGTWEYRQTKDGMVVVRIITFNNHESMSMQISCTVL